MRALSSDQDIKTALTEAKSIAIIGISKNETKASYFVGRYMQRRGYHIIPINPVYAGDTILGETVLADLADVPQDVAVDIVDIFRRSEFVPEIVDQAIARLTPPPKTIWMQFGIEHAQAAEKARAHGIQTIEDRCPKIEYQRLFGELRRAGINTGIVTSKLPHRG